MTFSQKLTPGRRFARQAAAAAFAGGVLAGLVALPLAAKAQTAGGRSEPPRVLTVSGEGVVQAVPDIASVIVGVVTQGKNASDATRENTAATGAVVAAFKEAGIEQRDLATNGFSVQPRYVYPKNGGSEAPRIDGYEVRNTLTVRVRDLGKLGGILDTAIATGSNQIGGISFDVADDAPLLDKARAQAVEDARRKADIFAQAAGVKLGKVIAIDGGSFGRPQPRAFQLQAARADAFSAKAAPVPVEAGEQEFRASVTVTWELTD
ncbi:hypothetical protein FHS82_000583 [Pseudochelatococcus lubricantis]|uniref:SIMPL domain-containing protein n=1 Tax=Pseudochelatococcus lubricantis TaxID=1538102 RepID=A0ABX0UYV7_9HYPH|nr:SIMPL domain-containing protein [Pseudochelatococcus lubricantis]NIJ56770.1 hypothetical protein [Pseudochelatococcus lubricantis]